MSSLRLPRVVHFGLAFALVLVSPAFTGVLPVSPGIGDSVDALQGAALQARVSAACPAGQPVRGINADGSAAVLNVVKCMNPSRWY
ncbi:MAG: hypothetical protein K8I65_03150 [Thermoanaerobaculia bacterium]|nr:hypothetical protein [Thermoanaerobaculia bacterium]